MEFQINFPGMFKRIEKAPSYLEQTRIDADRDGVEFGKILDRYLPTELNHPNRILDICVGIAPEEVEVISHFGVKQENLISVEKIPDLVSMAGDIGRKTVVAGDLSDQEYITSLVGNFDLVIGRNVPLDPSESASLDDKWLTIFNNIRDLMTNGGKLLITLLREDEFAVAGELLTKAGFTLEVCKINDAPTPSKIIGVASEFKDNYILVAKKT